MIINFRLLITFSVSLFAFVTSSLAQNKLVNSALRITDSLLVHGSLVDSEHGIIAIADPYNCINIHLGPDLVIGDIEDLGLSFKYSVGSEVCSNSVSISISMEEDFLRCSECQYLSLRLKYNFRTQLPDDYPVSTNFWWHILFYPSTDNTILKYEIVEMCE